MLRSPKSLREIVTLLQENDIKTTLLGIGPMSEVVIRASMELARDAEFPVMLIASRNQIDSAELGGGYVMGWDQATFSDAVHKIADEVGFDGPLYLCRDHGGPWQRDNERLASLSEEEAMLKAKDSYLADLKAGFNLLHIDPTKDPHLGTPPMKTVIARTIELMEYCQYHVQKLNLPAVSYEVGTEEVTGGLTSGEAFERFISDLLGELDRRDLPHPAFIVGQTGTLVKMDKNVGNFEPETAKSLCQIARRYGLGFKEHNADYLPLDVLKMHPDLGITGANVAPEFGLVETSALVELAKKEEAMIKRACLDEYQDSRDMRPSNFLSSIQGAALKSGRWRKWLIEGDAHLTEDDIVKNRQKLEEIALVCGHYVFSLEEVQRARKALYNNLIRLKITDSPEADLVSAIKGAIMKYVSAFNLRGLNSKLTSLP